MVGAVHRTCSAASSCCPDIAKFAAAARLLRRVPPARLSSRREVCRRARKASADTAAELALLLRFFAMDLASALAELATISDQKTKIERYKAVLQDLLAQQHVAQHWCAAS